MKITFGRGLLSVMLTIYFTTFLLTLVGHTSVVYKAIYFESQVALNVTIMLVQVTVFTAVSQINNFYLLGRVGLALSYN